MSIIISDEVLQQAHITEEELRQEIAILLFQKEKLSLAQASKLARMNRIQFQHLLASRQISIHYNVEDFDRDLKILRNMDRI